MSENAADLPPPPIFLQELAADGQKGRTPMTRSQQGLVCALVIAGFATAAAAQGAGGPGQPWRGAGPQPCFGFDQGVLPCSRPPGAAAIRAGRMFDSNT